MSQQIVKEHKLGCSVATARCDQCGKFCDAMLDKHYIYATGGIHFNEITFLCRKCNYKIPVPREQIELLNRYSEPSRESFDRIVWQSPPRIKVQPKGETFFPV